MSIQTQGFDGAGTFDHEFKSHPDVFWPAARGEKTFEYRRDDRGGYEVGQTVRLRCFDPAIGYEDVAPLDRRITNILRGGEFELPQGYCILSLAPLADGAGTKTARFKPGDLVLNARYAHRDAYPALGENAYVQAVDGDYLDFGQGSKLLYSLFDPVIPALASPRADSAERTVGTDLDDRLRAAGMFTIPEMMGETPLTRWQTHAATTSLDAFEWWLDAQVRQYLTMKAEYEIGDKPKDDELYEWVLAHSGAFHVIRTNFRAAKAATPAPATPPGVPDSLRALSGAVWKIRTELAALIPDPDKAKVEDWPVANPADAECLHRALVLTGDLLTDLAAQPAGQAGDAGIEATQITLGEGLVDITRIDHEGRTGVLFRPRKEHIAFGELGELPEGTYWPLKGDVVLWVSGEGPGVAIKALADLAPNSTRTGAAETEGLPWRGMKTAPTGTPIVAKHKPEMGMPHGWVAVILLGHRDDEEAGSLDTILHYNGNALYRGFHGCWDGWLPVDALAARPEAPSDAGWSFDMEAAPSDGSDVEIVNDRGQFIAQFDEAWGEGGWWMVSDGKDPDRPLRGSAPFAWRLPTTPPSDPAPSGQAEG